MYLRDRSGSNRGPEAGVDLGKRFAEGGDDRGFRLVLRERRHLVLQAFQIARDRRANHVGASGEDLPELDVSRSEPGQCGGKPTRSVFGGRALDQSRQRDGGLGRQRQRPRIDQREYAFAREYKAGAGEAEEMRGGSDHSRQPECSATMPPVMGVNDTRRKPAASIIVAKAFGLGNFRIDSTRYW